MLATATAMVLALASATGASDLYQRFQELVDVAKPILREGRYDEALAIAGPSWLQLDEPLLELARDAKARGDIDGCLQRYQAFFYYFGASPSFTDLGRWSNAAFDFTELRARRGDDPLPDDVKHDLEAADVYRKFVAGVTEFHAAPPKLAVEPNVDGVISQKVARDRCFAIASEIIEKHPRSLFCLSAAMTCRQLRLSVAPRNLGEQERTGEIQRRDDAQLDQVLEGFRTRLEASGAPRRIQLQLLMVQGFNLKSDQPRRVAVLRRVAEETPVAVEKRWALLQLGDSPWNQASSDPAVQDEQGELVRSSTSLEVKVNSP